MRGWAAAAVVALCGPWASPPGATATFILVGRGACADGTPLLAHIADSGPIPSDPRLIRVPGGTHPAGSRRPVYPIHPGAPRMVAIDRGPGYTPRPGQRPEEPLGSIPQVGRTHALWEADIALTNEVGLSLAHAPCRTRATPGPLPTPPALLTGRELSRLALERCATARCAVRTIGALADHFGFQPDDNGLADPPGRGRPGGAAFGLVDAGGEAWVMHLLQGPANSSAVWVAQRVADDEVAVNAGGFQIRAVNTSDSSRCLASDNVAEAAEQRRWWKPSDGAFDFTAAYGDADTTPAEAACLGRRVWRALSLLAPGHGLDPALGWWVRSVTYPFSLRPDKPVKVGDLIRVMRDFYDGTPYDLTVGLAAGPFQSPMRDPGTPGPGGWECPLSAPTARYSSVAQARPQAAAALRGLLWFGWGVPHAAVYVPVYGSQDALPDSYATGTEAEFTLHSAWRASDFLGQWSQLKFMFMRQDLEDQQRALEDEGRHRVAVWDLTAASFPDVPGRVRFLTAEASRFSERVADAQWALAFHLIAKYSNGNLLLGERTVDLRAPGYPSAWLDLAGFHNWPGDTWRPPPTPRSPLNAFQLGALGLSLCGVLLLVHRVARPPSVG